MLLWRGRSPQLTEKAAAPVRQLPITGSAHKARVVGDADLAAVGTLLDMAAERRGAAGLDGGHDPTLPVGQGGGVSGAEGSAVVAEDVRHLQRGRHVSGV